MSMYLASKTIALCEVPADIFTKDTVEDIAIKNWSVAYQNY